MESATNSECVGRIIGHDEVFDPPASHEFKCPICKMVLRNPVQTACGHRFCCECIKGPLEVNGSKCPLDNAQLDKSEIYFDRFAKREINQLTVKCRTVMSKKECPWSGPLQNIEEHLKTCEFAEVPCPNGCCRNVERKALDYHVKNECSKRLVVCSHCKAEVQHKNYKGHLGRCEKVTVACSCCNKKMLREKLISQHYQKCPHVQVDCDFKPFGCKWKGPRLHIQNHITDAVNMSAHVSMIAVALEALFPHFVPTSNTNGYSASGGFSAGGNNASGGNSASGYGTSGGAVECSSWQSAGASAFLHGDLYLQRSSNTKSINSMEARCEELEQRYRDRTGRIERQAGNEITMAAKSTLIDEARISNGVLMWRIQDYGRCLENARENITTVLRSPPFYTSLNGYKLCVRMYPYGVGTGYGSHVSLFVHFMQSSSDEVLQWPFSGRIYFSLSDQSVDDGDLQPVSDTFTSEPHLLQVQKPTTNLNEIGCGFEEFATFERVREYVNNDCLHVRVQVYQ